MLNFIYWYASEKVGKSLHKALNLKVPPPSLQLRKSTANTSIVCTVYPSSVIILFIVVCTFCFHSSVFFFIYPCLLPNLSCSFLLYFCIYLFLALWPIHVPFHPVIYFFFCPSARPQCSCFLLTLLFSYFFPLYIVSYFSFVDYLYSDTFCLSFCLFLLVHILQTYSLCCTAA